MMLPTNNIFGAFYRVLSDPPATLDVAVMAPVYRKKSTDNRDFAKVRPKSRPEPIPRAREVVRPDDVKDPVPHVSTPVCDFRVGVTVSRTLHRTGVGGWYRYPGGMRNLATRECRSRRAELNAAEVAQAIDRGSTPGRLR